MAFKRLYRECRVLFISHFNKRYPDTKISIVDLYQDSIMEFWSQIIDGKITQHTLKCKPATYVISIGENKMKEGYRKILNNDKLVDNLRIVPDHFKVTKGVRTPIFNTENENTNIFMRIKNKDRKGKEYIYIIEDLGNWSKFLNEEYEDVGFPCSKLLRDTWYNDLTDNEILDEFNGYFSNTDTVKTKRYKCHKSLLNLYNIWKQNKIGRL